ncbi:hypothetical protein Tco_0744209 [Tanacetum coccineum]
MMEQQVLSLVAKTQLVIVVKLERMHVGIVVDDEVLHKLVGKVEKNELFEELMIVVVDTEQNLTEFDS